MEVLQKTCRIPPNKDGRFANVAVDTPVGNSQVASKSCSPGSIERMSFFAGKEPIRALPNEIRESEESNLGPMNLDKQVGLSPTRPGKKMCFGVSSELGGLAY